jgi:hypothetical protein
MARHLIYYSVLILYLVGCKEQSGSTSGVIPASCKGEWTEKDENGLVRKRFAESWNSGMQACLTENKPLTQWETSLNTRFDHDVTCTPQSDLPTMWLRSANGYYTYRNDRVFIELNASTGQARRLIFGETPDGRPSYTRQAFCYFLRTDNETEPVNPTDYKSMLLFDLELGAGSNLFRPMEIYNYVVNGNDLRLTMMSDNSGVDWTWCPTTTPVGFCDYMRNGNDMYYPPDPGASMRAQLTVAALLIRNEHNFVKITEDEFNTKWNSTTASSIEVGTSAYIDAGGKWKYLLSPFFDEPLYIGRNWRSYLSRDPQWPFMPDVSWASSMGMPFVCYSTKKEILLNSGSKAWIEGEACYSGDGNYTFTQN